MKADVETNGKEVDIGVDVNDDGKDDFKFTIKGKVGIAVAVGLGIIALLIGAGVI